MYLKYLWYVLRHKYYVFIEACRLGIPLLGLTHDLSKFLPREFIAYARYFYGDYPDEDPFALFCKGYTGLTKSDINARFSFAWNAHQKANPHHWQYWILINDSDDPQLSALEMPPRRIKEMVADWRGAGRALGKPDTVKWYRENAEKMMLNYLTRDRVEILLGL